jgi:hypothetical protein
MITKKPRGVKMTALIGEALGQGYGGGRWVMRGALQNMYNGQRTTINGRHRAFAAGNGIYRGSG